MADVFISYAREDKELAQNIAAALHKLAVDAWIELHTGLKAEGWWTEISRVIASSNVVLCLLSNNWLKSIYCQAELSEAMRLNKRLIPVVIDKIKSLSPELIHDFLKGVSDDGNVQILFDSQDPVSVLQNNWRAVSKYNFLFLDGSTDFEAFIDDLMMAIMIDAEHTRKHTHYLMSAKKWDVLGRKSEYLLRGEELHQAIAWLDRSADKAPSPTDLHRQFISEAHQFYQKQQGTHSSRLRTAIQWILPLGPRKIFLSYRRDDSADACGRIYDRLKPVFGSRNLFLDVDTIEFGTDFSQYIQQTLTECFAVLAVIGPGWLDMLNERAKRDDRDFVKIELEVALKRHHVNVIPLLVSGASMPDPNKLPSSLRSLTMMNGTQVRAGRDFHRDMDVLIKELKQLRQKTKNAE